MMIVPSRIVCGVIEPWGSAVYSPTCTPAPPGNPSRACAGDDEAANVVLRHARLQRPVGRFVRLQRDRRREPHQLELVRVLDHPAAGGDRRAARRASAAARPARRRRSNTNLIVSSMPSAPGGDAAVLQALRDQLVGALVLVPRPHVGRAAAERSERDLLARAVLLERRADEERLALGRDDAGEQPLAAAPADVGEVDERGAAASASARRSCARPSAAAPSRSVPRRSSAVIGSRLRAHRGQRRDRGRQRGALRGRGSHAAGDETRPGP